MVRLYSIDAGKINVVVTPEGSIYCQQLLSRRRYVWRSGKWALADCVKFNHSDADVYEDPEFTLMVTTTQGQSVLEDYSTRKY